METGLVKLLINSDTLEIGNNMTREQFENNLINSLLPKTQWDCCISDDKLVLL